MISKKLNLKKLLVQSALLITITAFSSCKDEFIQLKGDDTSKYEIANLSGQLVGQGGKALMSNFDFQNEGSYKFNIQLNKNSTGVGTGKLIYDETVLNSYNQKNGTNFIAYPKDLVEFINAGAVNIPAGSNVSDKIEVKIKANTAANPADVFVIPVKANFNASGSNVDNLDYLLFVKDLTKGASAEKSTGLKTFSIIEVNNVNPLMNLAFTLKNSGKPLFDHVVLFSSNINFDENTGRVYINHNENLTHILQNRDKYIKPLQDRGIKVSLSLLGNHDKSGVSNLSDETIKYFAQEIKRTCDAYGLDGVFYDDEYSAYKDPAPAGFEKPSNSRAAKLMYEVKKLMPHRDNMVYVYSNTDYFGNTPWGNYGIDEAEAGEYVDYAIHDYFGNYDLTESYPGLDKKRWIMLSSEYARNYFTSISSLRGVRANGQGGTMVFSLNPHNSNVASQLNHMRNIATAFYDDELVYDAAKAFRKDW